MPLMQVLFHVWFGLAIFWLFPALCTEAHAERATQLEAMKKGLKTRWEARQLEPISWKKSSCADYKPPRWFRHIVPPHSFEKEKAPCRKDTHETNPNSAPKTSPSLSAGGTRPIPRINASNMDLKNFYINHARTGVPLIVTGAFEEKWLADRRKEIGSCCQAEHDGNRKRWGAFKEGVLTRGGELPLSMTKSEPIALTLGVLCQSHGMQATLSSATRPVPRALGRCHRSWNGFFRPHGG